MLVGDDSWSHSPQALVRTARPTRARRRARRPRRSLRRSPLRRLSCLGLPPRGLRQRREFSPRPLPALPLRRWGVRKRPTPSITRRCAPWVAYPGRSAISRTTACDAPLPHRLPGGRPSPPSAGTSLGFAPCSRMGPTSSRVRGRRLTWAARSRLAGGNKSRLSLLFPPRRSDPRAPLRPRRAGLVDSQNPDLICLQARPPQPLLPPHSHFSPLPAPGTLATTSHRLPSHLLRFAGAQAPGVPLRRGRAAAQGAPPWLRPLRVGHLPREEGVLWCATQTVHPRTPT